MSDGLTSSCSVVPGIEATLIVLPPLRGTPSTTRSRHAMLKHYEKGISLYFKPVMSSRQHYMSAAGVERLARSSINIAPEPLNSWSYHKPHKQRYFIETSSALASQYPLLVDFCVEVFSNSPWWHLSSSLRLCTSPSTKVQGTICRRASQENAMANNNHR